MTTHEHKHPSIQVSQMRLDALKDVSVCFINMPLRESAKPNTPPNGPGLMAARLRQYGAKPTIVDLNAYRVIDEHSQKHGLPNGRHLTLTETEVLLLAHFGRHGQPDIIALSGMITTLRWQENIARICRRISPESFIVSGGGLATEIKSGLLQWIPELDSVAHSEGDDIILLMAKDVKHLKDRYGNQRYVSKLEQAPYHTLLGNRIVYHGDRPINLDVLPFPAWDLLHQDVANNPVLEWYIQTPVWGTAANNSSATSFAMERSMTTVSSRGCPYSCKFCFRGAQGERNYGMRSPENLRAEAEWIIHEYGIDFLGFPDDNFAVNPKRIQALPKALGDLGLRWGTHTRLDEADERAKWMAQAGCVYIGFGAESASAKILEEMGKGGFILRPKGARSNQLESIDNFQFPTTMMNGIRKCWEVGIHANCTWIMGYPGETLHDLQTSVAFMKWQIDEATKGKTPGTSEYDLAVQSINTRMFVATAYPGTAMCLHPKVQEALKVNFGITFERNSCGNVEPVIDKNLREYVLALDDATKVLHNAQGKPLYYGNMSLERFLEARNLVDDGRTLEILNMS